MQYCFYLDWKGLTSAEWAAWVQAVGSVAAILGAFLVADRQHRKSETTRKRREDAQARSLALVHFGQIQASTARAEVLCRELKGKDGRDAIRVGGAFFEFPPELQAAKAATAELGDAARPVQAFLMHAESLAMVLQEVDRLAAKGKDYEFCRDLFEASVRGGAQYGREATAMLQAVLLAPHAPRRNLVRRFINFVFGSKGKVAEPSTA